MLAGLGALSLLGGGGYWDARTRGRRPRCWPRCGRTWRCVCVRAVLRRAAPSADEGDGIAPTLAKGRRLGFGLDARYGRPQIIAPGVLVDLSGGEYELLLALLECPNILLTRNKLLDITRGRYAGPSTARSTCRSVASDARSRSDPKNPNLIKTTRCGGYGLASQVKAR
jgi:two-component system OmpR family response regulator